MRDEGRSIRRWRAGHRAAARLQRLQLVREGAKPAQAIAESLAALNALEAMGLWPSPRDPVTERSIERVRARWALVEKRAKRARAR
jgi:hypothetical protein